MSPDTAAIDEIDADTETAKPVASRSQPEFDFDDETVAPKPSRSDSRSEVSPPKSTGPQATPAAAAATALPMASVDADSKRPVSPPVVQEEEEPARSSEPVKATHSGSGEDKVEPSATAPAPAPSPADDAVQAAGPSNGHGQPSRAGESEAVVEETVVEDNIVPSPVPVDENATVGEETIAPAASVETEVEPVQPDRQAVDVEHGATAGPTNGSGQAASIQPRTPGLFDAEPAPPAADAAVEGPASEGDDEATRNRDA